MKSFAAITCAFACALMCALSIPRPAEAASVPTTSFTISDRNGAALGCAGFTALQRNGHDDAGWNDALLDRQTLRVRTMSPLECTNGRLRVRGADATSTLSLAWPSRAGYSMLLLDLGASSTKASSSFEAAVAEQGLRDVAATREHLGLRPSLPVSLDRLAARLRRASGPARARLAWQVWDASVDAAMQALVDVGGARPTSGTVRRGVTFASLDIDDGDWAAATTTVGTGGWIRLLLDVDEPLASYRPVVDRAHRLGLRVLGQFLDSAQMRRLDVTGWQRRVDAALQALPGVDGWEVGNEANGNWLGDGVLAKVAFAASRVKAVSPQARTMLTLLWNLGEDTPSDSMFNWLATVPASTLADVDDIGLSLYPEAHPLGIAYDRVMTTLHRAAPRATLLISELGYGNDDLTHTWWWGSPTDTTRARRDVARLYDAASRAHPFAGGGTFWWYFLAEGDVR